jgi:2-keto-4-pentenoate hydratase/2-oxohepta-3-ene-1,7-dioic acid hydratase in catechol pathway
MTNFSFAVVEIPASSAPVLAVAAEPGVVPVRELMTGTEAVPEDLGALLGDWDRWCDAVEEALSAGDAAGIGWTAPEKVSFRPPAAGRPAVYCAGANYVDHVAEMGAQLPNKAESAPYHFVVPSGTLNGHRGIVRKPADCAKLDWEVELAAVIGRPAENVGVDDALGYLAGYTVANDVSCRQRPHGRHPVFGMDWLRMKAGPTLTPLGPGLVPARFVPDPMRLGLSLRVNGTLRQDSNTDKMIFSLSEQIARLSSLVALEPGDIILTGTPAGTAAASGEYLEAGDVMLAEIEGLGQLENTVA